MQRANLRSPMRRMRQHNSFTHVFWKCWMVLHCCDSLFGRWLPLVIESWLLHFHCYLPCFRSQSANPWFACYLFLPEDEWEHDGSQTRSWENRTLPTDQTQAGVELAKRIWTSMFDTNLQSWQLKKADESNIKQHKILKFFELVAIDKANLVFAWSIWLSWQTGWAQTRGFPCPRQVSPHFFSQSL